MNLIVSRARKHFRVVLQCQLSCSTIWRPIVQSLKKKELNILTVHTLSSYKAKIRSGFSTWNWKGTEASYRMSYHVAASAGKLHPGSRGQWGLEQPTLLNAHWTEVSKIQVSVISCVTTTCRTKDLVAKMKTELIFCLQTLTVAQLVSAPATL